MALHRYPFVRILLPLAGGIYVGDELFFKGATLSTEPIYGALFALFISLAALYLLQRFTLRWVFGGCLFLFCLLSGFSRMFDQLQQTAVHFPTEETIYHLSINNKPEQRGQQLLYNTTWNGKEILLYLPKDERSEHLRCGDELLVTGRPTTPLPSGNPDAFDYPRYLRHKQISALLFCTSDRWKLIGHHPTRSLKQQALAWRERLLNHYRELGFSGDELAVLQALTVGYKEDLSETIRESYAISGASHVLALSGLHIGFLYALLLYGMRILPNSWRGSRLLRTGTILSLLWGFAFFTGLSPSVVRAVLMCSIFTLSTLFSRDAFSINTLGAAAFFMLLFQPAWLFDVGFQLSFCAVAAILFLQPLLYRLIPVSNRLVRPVWQLITVSLAAQLGAAPLVLYYFSRFSTHFLLTNLLIMLPVSFILYGTVLLLILNPFATLQWGIARVVNQLLQLLNDTVRWVEQLPLASIDRVWIYPLEIMLFYLLLYRITRYALARSGSHLLQLIGCLLLLLTTHTALVWNDRPRQSLRFYQVYDAPAVQCMSAEGHTWIVYADSLPNQQRLQRVASRHWQRKRIASPRPIIGDYQDDELTVHDGILSFGGRRISLVNDNRWQGQVATHPLRVDYLYICKGYSGELRALTSLFCFSTVILDTSLSPYRLEALKQELLRLNYPFISLREKGSLQILL